MKMNRFILAASLTLGAATPPSGYLPALGPAPLRQETVAKITITLPPLEMHDTPINPELSLAAEFIGPPLPPPPPIAPQIVETNLLIPTNAIAVVAQPPANRLPGQNDIDASTLLFGTNQASASVNAKMFVQFFQQNPSRTNGASRVILPIEFNPPAPPAQLPSSTATYSTPSR